MGRRAFSVGKPKWKRPLGLPKQRWADNTKMGLREIRQGGINWTHLAKYRDTWRALVNIVIIIRVP
jgi:hypothetical protein